MCFADCKATRYSSHDNQPRLYSFAFSRAAPITRKISLGHPLTSSNFSSVALATVSRISWEKHSLSGPAKARMMSSLDKSYSQWAEVLDHGADCKYQAKFPRKKTARRRRLFNPSTNSSCLHTDIAPVMCMPWVEIPVSAIFKLRQSLQNS